MGFHGVMVSTQALSVCVLSPSHIFTAMDGTSWQIKSWDAVEHHVTCGASRDVMWQETENDLVGDNHARTMNHAA